MQQSLAAHAADLNARREAYARALVVRAQAPTSAHPGDEAIITTDGNMSGFVGGQCAAETVRLAAVEAIGTGQSVLLRILPGDDPAGFPETDGARVSVNRCLSGGAVEVFVEPVLPVPILHVCGSTPVARAVVEQARLLGYEVTRSRLEDDAPAAPLQVADLLGARAVVVAVHGDGTEPDTIRAALDAGVPSVQLVASIRRSAGLLGDLDLTEAERARIHSPAGIRIGAVTPAEIAVSIMAQVIAQVHEPEQPAVIAPADPAAVPPVPEAPRQELDPVCGMSVLVTDRTPTVTIDGTPYWFCCNGCRDSFAAGQGARHGAHG